MASLDTAFRTLNLEQASPNLAVKDNHSHSRRGVLKFESLKCIGKFSTGKNATYSTLEVAIPRLIPRPIMQNILGFYLGTDNNRAVLIPNYKDFHDQKQEFFLKWIHDSKFFTGVSQGKYKKPEFICFGSCLYFPMMTPCVSLRGDWDVYAVKIHDVIYLWSEKQADFSKSLESYYGIYFEHLLTHQNPTATSPNEYEKVFVVNELKFGSHQLLCLSEIDAEDDTGRWVEIKVFKQCSPKGTAAKHLKFWAQSVVSGTQTLVLGKRDDSGNLLQIEATTTDNLAREFEWDWNSQVCYDFQDRLLTWIKSHFSGSNPTKVKKFSWQGSSDPFVYASDVAERYIPKALLRLNAFNLQ